MYFRDTFGREKSNSQKYLLLIPKTSTVPKIKIERKAKIAPKVPTTAKLAELNNLALEKLM